jgi:hypothetical protein
MAARARALPFPLFLFYIFIRLVMGVVAFAEKERKK